MIQSVELTTAEALLLKIEQERHAETVQSSTQRLENALRAIYLAHGWVWGQTKGQMQKDPLDTSIIRFVYDDGKQPGEKPDLKIVDVEPIPDQARQVPA
jgi:hypothetical protein